MLFQFLTLGEAFTPNQRCDESQQCCKAVIRWGTQVMNKTGPIVWLWVGHVVWFAVLALE